MRLDGSDLDGALFCNAISSDIPDSASLVFSEGERICAAVSEAREDGRVRLSTRVLESEYGEMRSAEGVQAVIQRAAAGPRFVELPEQREAESGGGRQHWRSDHEPSREDSPNSRRQSSSEPQRGEERWEESWPRAQRRNNSVGGKAPQGRGRGREWQR